MKCTGNPDCSGPDCEGCENEPTLIPPTPPRGQPMPQTRAYWEKRAAMDYALIMEQQAEISRLKETVNKLRQKHG